MTAQQPSQLLAMPQETLVALMEYLEWKDILTLRQVGLSPFPGYVQMLS